MATWIGPWSPPGFEVDLTDFWEKEWAFHHCRWRLWLQPTSHRRDGFRTDCVSFKWKNKTEILNLWAGISCTSMTLNELNLEKKLHVLSSSCRKWSQYLNNLSVCYERQTTGPLCAKFCCIIQHWSYTTITLSLKADIVNTSLETVSNICDSVDHQKYFVLE